MHPNFVLFTNIFSGDHNLICLTYMMLVWVSVHANIKIIIVAMTTWKIIETFVRHLIQGKSWSYCATTIYLSDNILSTVLQF